MIITNKTLQKLAIVPLLLLIACGQNNSNKKAIQSDNNITGKQIIKVGTFSTFPSEIEGCSCYFSNDTIEFKKGEYIYVNDFAKTSFMKINGTLTKFTQTDFKKVNDSTTVEKAKNEQYELIIEVVNGIQSGEETMIKTGTIKLTDKNGVTVTKTFYGECGC